MATFRNAFRILKDPALTERVYGSILTKVHAVSIDTNSSATEKKIAFGIYMESYPQRYIDAAMRAIAGNPTLVDLVVVTETGTPEQGNVSYKLDTSPVSDEQIASVIDTCWAVLLAQQPA